MGFIFSRRGVLTVVSGTVLISVGCTRDDVTQPATPGRRLFPTTPVYDLDNSPDQVSAPVGATDPWTGGSSVGTGVTFGTYPYATVVVATASGMLTRTPNYSATGDVADSWGPTGNAYLGYRDKYNSTGGTNFPHGSGSTAVDTLLVQGVLEAAGRNGYGARQYDGYNGVWCGAQRPEHNRCDDWSGGSTITVQRLNAEMTAWPDSEVVVVGSVVHLLQGATPSSWGSFGVPFVGAGVDWIPSDTSNGGDPNDQPVTYWACQQYISPCGRVITGSGTFRPAAYINGKWKQTTVSVRAIPAVNSGDNATHPRPKCENYASLDSVAKSWCDGSPPDSTQRARIDAALANMRSIGGICVTLANIGDAVLNRGDLHLYSTSSWPGFGGGAPQGGGASGGYSWVTLANGWTNNYYDASHKDGSGRDLQQLLAHEFDHLNNGRHLTNDNSKTTHSDQCGGG
ncbi:MAG: hypothetical protein JWM41_3391 [Gemmatimonadetes bacterium]|nr:hypothetical protein [Gemmatimonadota bacterium]